MAEEILKRELDTYAPEKCASACADLFAAGEKSWITPKSVLGLHRSGHECAPDAGTTSHDRIAAEFLSSRGVAAGFIQRALDTPYDGIWLPDIRAPVGLRCRQRQPLMRRESAPLFIIHAESPSVYATQNHAARVVRFRSERTVESLLGGTQGVNDYRVRAHLGQHELAVLNL